MNRKNNNGGPVSRVDYVVGFYFNEDLSKVALLRKTKPDWQKGLLNGPGGKKKASEDPAEAMYREMVEETGAHVLVWKYVGVLSPEANVKVFYFAAKGKQQMQSMPDEPVDWYSVDKLMDLPVVPNLVWLIPMARLKFVNPAWREIGTFVTA